jgi:RecB family exonuclease
MLKAAKAGDAKAYINEIALYNDKLKYAGRADMIGTWKGYEAVIDFKTSKKVKKDGWLTDYKIQCTAYALAHNEMFDTNIKYFVILIGIPGELKSQVVIGNIGPWIPYLYTRVNEFYYNLEGNKY